jgi:hypothetical protein
MALLNASAVQVYDLIASENAATWPVTPVTLTYGTPTALTGDASGKDTSLLVSAAANTVYTGSVTIFYNRLDLAGFETNYGVADLIVGEDPTPADIVAQFNVFYDASLDASDYVNNPVVPRGDYPEEYFPDYDGEIYIIVAAPGSLAYKGEAPVQIRLESALLSSILVVNELDGLEFPEAP